MQPVIYACTYRSVVAFVGLFCRCLGITFCSSRDVVSVLQLLYSYVYPIVSVCPSHFIFSVFCLFHFHVHLLFSVCSSHSVVSIVNNVRSIVYIVVSLCYYLGIVAVVIIFHFHMYIFVSVFSTYSGGVDVYLQVQNYSGCFVP